MTFLQKHPGDTGFLSLMTRYVCTRYRSGTCNNIIVPIDCSFLWRSLVNLVLFCRDWQVR